MQKQQIKKDNKCKIIKKAESIVVLLLSPEFKCAVIITPYVVLVALGRILIVPACGQEELGHDSASCESFPHYMRKSHRRSENSNPPSPRNIFQRIPTHPPLILFINHHISEKYTHHRHRFSNLLIYNHKSPFPTMFYNQIFPWKPGISWNPAPGPQIPGRKSTGPIRSAPSNKCIFRLGIVGIWGVQELRSTPENTKTL